MNVLLIWPKFPKSYWSFEAVLALAGKKAKSVSFLTAAHRSP